MINLKNYILGLLLIAFTLLHGYGQQDPRVFDASKKLSVGDTFVGPKQVSWMRGALKSMDWKSWQNKIIVLDFFDTYCSTCILSMPHLQKLQQQFGDKVQILNVTWQDKAILDKFYAGNEFLKEYQVNLPVIYNDKTLRSMFPHKASPHLAIIYKGKVQAITFNRLLTAANIEKLLREGTIQLPMKNDFGKGDLGATGSVGETGVWLSGYQDGVRSQALLFEKDSLSDYYKSSFYNRSIYISLINSWGKIKQLKAVLRPEQVIWNVKDSSKYKNFTNSGEAWDIAHAISYERKERLYRLDSVQARIVLQDLHSLLGIRSYWSTKLFKCLVLKKCPVQKSDKMFGEKWRYHGTDVLSKFLGVREDLPLIYDDAKVPDLLEIGLFRNVDELNEQLRQYGLELTEGEAKFETFVIEEEQRK